MSDREELRPVDQRLADRLHSLAPNFSGSEYLRLVIEDSARMILRLGAERDTLRAALRQTVMIGDQLVAGNADCFEHAANSCAEWCDKCQRGVAAAARHDAAADLWKRTNELSNERPWRLYRSDQPALNQPVIFYFETTGVCRGFYRGEGEHGGLFTCEHGFLTGDVTHWMAEDGQALPEAPEKVEAP